jgi:hypothetical protein
VLTAVGSDVGAAVGVAVGSNVGAGVGYCPYQAHQSTSKPESRFGDPTRLGFGGRTTPIGDSGCGVASIQGEVKVVTSVGEAVGVPVGTLVGTAVGYCRGRGKDHIIRTSRAIMWRTGSPCIPLVRPMLVVLTSHARVQSVTPPTAVGSSVGAAVGSAVGAAVGPCHGGASRSVMITLGSSRW